MIKIIPADKYFSLCVRERADNKCEFDGVEYSQGLQCCHFETRGNWSVRFDPLNAFALCYAHHTLLDGSPIRFTEFYLEKRGQLAYDVLVEKSRDTMLGKQNRREKDQIAQWYKEVYSQMLMRRSLGETGWLEFVGYA